MSWVRARPAVEGGRARRGSLLGRIVAAFVVVLTLSATVVAFFETDRNREALLAQSHMVVSRDLAIVRASMASDLADQLAVVGGIARDLRTSNAIRQRDSAMIRALLLPSADTPLFDYLGVVTSDGFDVHATSGGVPQVAWEAIEGPVSGLVVYDGLGNCLVLVSESLGPGASLVGATLLDDAWAYRMRSLIGQQVVIVVDGELKGSTLPSGASSAPGWTSGHLDEEVRSVEFDGEATLVGYAPIARRQAGFGVDAWVGVTARNPLAALDAALFQDRLLALALLAFLGLLLALVLFRWVLRPVGRLTAAASRIADGELDGDFSTTAASGELDDLARALDHMVCTLRENTSTIERQATDLRLASERLVQARDDERQRMAATLHDGFQQRLVILRMRLRGLSDNSSRDEREALAEDVLFLLADLRRLSHDLYPSILRDRGLGAGIHSLVSAAPADVRALVEPEALPRLPLDVEANAYFLAAEGLTNALKHAPGSPVLVSVRAFAEELEVCVIDGGPGFDIHASRGAGLLGFEDRAAAVGGTVQLTSDENGTWVVARLPLQPDATRPHADREPFDRVWEELHVLRDHLNRSKAAGIAAHDFAGESGPLRAGTASPGGSPSLQEQQYGGDTAIEV